MFTTLATIYYHGYLLLWLPHNRTAFELAKLLLSLSPDGDPLGLLLCIGTYYVYNTTVLSMFTTQQRLLLCIGNKFKKKKDF